MIRNDANLLSEKRMPGRHGAPPTIGDYGLIGDCETAALVSGRWRRMNFSFTC